MSTILEIIGRFILEVLIEALFCWTGEVVLFLVTLGRHKPRWNLYTSEDAGAFVFLSEVSFWVGFAFWLLVGYLIYRYVAS